MTEPRPRRLVALCAALLVGVACTSNDDDGGDATPSPPSSPTSEENNGDEAPTSLDEETAAGQYVALQHAIIQLAPIDPDDIDVDGAGAGDGIVTDSSPAAQFLTDRLTTMAETGTGPSGEVVDAEVLELRDTGQQASAELCVLQETEPVDLSTGEPAAGAPAQPDARYLQIEVAYTNLDGDWLIDELPGLEDDGRPDDCVPPSIAQAVHANWEAHDEAGRRWIDSGFAIEERAALEPLVTEARWEEIEAVEAEEPTGRVRGDIVYGLELLSATRTEVVGEWCIDGSRDPDATTIRNGEVVPNEDRLLTRGRWQLEDGEWLVAMYDESEGDQTILEGTVDAPEGHRCL